MAVKNVSELVQYQGQTRLLRTGIGESKTELKIEVKVLEVRQVWDRIDLKVSPVNGEGEAWVSLSRTTEKQ